VASTTAMSVRLWGYGGSGKDLTSITWRAEGEFGKVFDTVTRESEGKPADTHENRAIAHFQDPLHALTAAKSLQQKLLALRQETGADQVVAAVLVQPMQSAVESEENTPTEVISPPYMLAERDAARILVTSGIYEIAKSVPGFEFSAKPAHDTAEGGGSESLYELLWADQSTYGHLRQAVTDAGIKPPAEGRYETLDELGRGAMGVVYKAYDRLIGRTVALKTISIASNNKDRNELVERLKQEAKAAGKLDHPNIVTIYDIGQEEGRVYLSMQYVEGTSLYELVKNGDLPPLATLLSYTDQICDAVGFAHEKGVIHRDLKPPNIMVTKQGVIKVLDFGIAKLGDAALTQAGMVVGTPNYMAPEQAMGKKIDYRSDIFSLGAVFYELFTRERPFRAEGITTVFYKLIHEDPVPPCVVNPALPGGIDAVIRKALEKDPKKRFQSCEELRKALREQASLLAPTPAATATPSIAAGAAVRMQPKPASSRQIKVQVERKKRSSGVFWLTFLFLVAGGAGVVKVWFPQQGAEGWAWVRAQAEQVRLKMIGAKPETPAAPSPTGGQAGSQPASSAPQTADQTKAFAPADGAGTSNAVNAAAGTAPAASQASSSGQESNPAQPTSAAPSEAARNPFEPPTNAQEAASPATGSPAAGPAATGDTHTGRTQAAPQSAAQVAAAADPNTQPVASKEKTVKRSAPRKPAGEARVDGFTKTDIPDLVHNANSAAGRGDNATARYEYGIILRLDPENAAAKEGLRRIDAAEKGPGR